MKYPHLVVFNGVWYPAGADVPADTTSATSKVISEPEVTKETEIVEKQEPIVELVEEPKAPTLKRSEIKTMKIEDLRKYAKEELGFNGVEEMASMQLRREVIKYLGL